MLGKLLKLSPIVRIVLWLGVLACWFYVVPWPQNPQPTVYFALACSVPFLSTIALLATFFPKSARKVNAFLWFTLQPWFYDQLLSAKFVGLTTTVLGSYNTAQNIWGKEWSFFKDHNDVHEQAKFWSFVVITVFAIGLFFKERWKESSLVGAESVLNAFVLMVGNVVSEKTDRLSDIAKLPPQQQKAALADLPLIQLRTILTQSAAFLQTSFKLRADQVDITVIEKAGSVPWTFLICHQKKWIHGDPANLLKPNYCAARVLESGHEIFNPSKEIAAEDSEYDLSVRDKQKGDGSIFCVPVTIKHRGTDWVYVVSIVTYGTVFCAKGDKRNEEKTLNLLRQIIRRIELELHQRVVTRSP